MTRISSKIVSKDLNGELSQNFSFLVSSLNNSRDIDEFFNSFLTKEEKTMIFKRLMLHLMLLNNIPSLEIKASLGMSNETIRTHKNKWDYLSNDYKDLLNKISKKAAIRRLIKKIDKKTEKIDASLKAKSSMKARSRVYDND